jgi:hypothetical protein
MRELLWSDFQKEKNTMVLKNHQVIKSEERNDTTITIDKYRTIMVVKALHPSDVFC